MDKIQLASNMYLEFQDGDSAHALANGGQCISYVLRIDHPDGGITKLYTHLHVGGESKEPYVRIRAMDMIEQVVTPGGEHRIQRSLERRYSD